MTYRERRLGAKRNQEVHREVPRRREPQRESNQREKLGNFVVIYSKLPKDLKYNHEWDFTI